MQRLLSGVGVLAAWVLLAVSMAMNWRFGFGLGRSDLDGHIFGAASAAADVLKALLPLFGLWAFRQGRWLVVVVAVLVWGICTTYSMTSALGFAALNRSDVTAERISKSENYLDQKKDIERLRSQLNGLPKHRPVKVVAASLAEYRQNRRWVDTDGCSNVTVERSRRYCAGYFKLFGEMEVAKKEVDIEQRIAKWSEVISRVASSVGGIGKADPQSAALSQLLGYSSDQMQLVFVVMLALLTEIGSGLGLFVCLGYTGDDSSEKARQHPLDIDDPRERFFVEAIRHSQGGKIKASDLYRRFLQWCKQNNIDPGMTLTAFGKWVVKQRGMEKTKIGGFIYYVGIGFRN